MRKRIPIILFSGMGADSRVFEKQIRAIPEISVPKWISPYKGESLESYSERFSEVVDPGGQCYVGGASFGGFVAMEMLKYLNVKKCFLIGSVRSPAEFPDNFNHLRKMVKASDYIPFELAMLMSRAALMSRGVINNEYFVNLLEQMSDFDASFLRWACRAVLEWEGSVDSSDVPVRHIHGEKDIVLPVENTSPDVVVAGAGHALSISHPEEVTRFLLDNIT